MNSPTPMQVITVSVVDANRVDCQPDSLTMCHGPVTLSFELSDDAKNAHWVFDTKKDPSVQGADQYYGINVYGDNGVEFTNVRHSATEVQFIDEDDSAHTYSYSVKLYNTKTHQRIATDPSIVNQSRIPP